MWQFVNFDKICYATLIGITVDFISFGNNLNYYIWISLSIIWLLYEFNRLMKENFGWKFIKHLF
jgi:hypothetical protein